MADEVVDPLLAWLASGAAVDDYLADQRVTLLALARAHSVFTYPTLSPHLRTVVEVVQQFLPVRITLKEGTPAKVRIRPYAAGKCLT